MRPPRLPVEHAAVAEVPAAGRARNRHDERLAPVAFRGQRSVDRVDLSALAIGTRLILRAELDIARLDRQLRRRKIDASDDERLGTLRLTAIGETQRDLRLVLADRRIEIDAN